MAPDTQFAANRIYVIRYAERAALRQDHFYGAIDRPTDPMPISYFVWLIVNGDSAILVDTGFTAATAALHGREYVISPRAAVKAVGIDPDALSSVVLTHIHYDHAGCVADFPAATFVLQEREVAYWTGRHAAPIARELGMSHLVLAEDVGFVVAANFEGRVQWVDGVATLAPGVTVHRVGGHTPGMQVVRVETSIGPVVLASDAAHFYENIETNRPFAVLDSVPGALDAFLAVRGLTTASELVVPGHDPAVLERFPSLDIPSLSGHAAVIG
jgi:glyoxylase-like metal-dependent hydrolase (beta-lactamase superfamily II)